MDLTSWFWDLFPFSGLLFVIPIIVIWVLKGYRKKGIENKVEVFFKGGTKQKFDCKVEKDMVIWKIEDNEYREPIIAHPRIERTGGEFVRTYLYAEGIGGTIDVPPLTKQDREKIIGYLRFYNILPVSGTAKKGDKDGKEIVAEKDLKTYKDSELMDMLRFYNFDIEQVLDKPMPKAFTTAVSAFQNMMDTVVNQIRSLEQKTSKLMVLGIFMVAFFLGFFVAYALTLKGAI